MQGGDMQGGDMQGGDMQMIPPPPSLIPFPPHHSRHQLQRVRDDQSLQEGHWLAALQGLVLNCTPHLILAFVAATWLTQVRGRGEGGGAHCRT